MEVMNLRRFFVLAGLGALGLVLAINFEYVGQFLALLHRVHWYVFPLVIAMQGMDYYFNAKYYQVIFRLLDFRIETRPLYEAALAINFVNVVFPSGGLSGASFLSRAFKNDTTAGKATLVQLGRYVFTFLSFLVVLTAGFVLLLLGNNVAHISVRVMLLFLAVVIGFSVLILTVLGERRIIEQIVTVLARTANRITHRLTGRRVLVRHESLNSFFDEFYDGYHFLMSERGQWHKPLLYCLGTNLAEVATVYVVFLSFGIYINPGVVIVGYTLANIFSVVAFFGSGAGVYEATMVAAFVALGVPLAVALSVVIVYRALNFLIFLPLGFHYYRKYL
jgi:uncharacterized protein (TIRG00374 family)